jgi:hypothetical protein
MKQNDRVPEVTPTNTGEHVGMKSGGESNNGVVPAGPRTSAQAQIPTGRVIDETRS